MTLSQSLPQNLSRNLSQNLSRTGAGAGAGAQTTRAARASAVRRATRADIGHCAAMLDAWIRASDWVPALGSCDALEARLADGLDTHILWVAGDPVRAFLVLEPGSGEIVVLFSGEPGQGHARALLDRAKARCETLAIHHHLANVAAQTFCRAQGFVPVGEHTSWSESPGRALRMEWWRGA